MTVITSTDSQTQLPSATGPTSTLLVADGQCPKIRELLAEALVPVLWLEAGQHPLKSVTAALEIRRQQGQPVEMLHWVSHGKPGVLQVGHQCVDRAALLQARDQLTSWQLKQLALWSCDYGADSNTLSLWEELLGASVYSSGGILGLDSYGRQNWTLHSQRHSNTIDWPLNFGDSSNWKHQLATVSYATFSEGPQASDPLSSSEQITAVGYAASLYSVDTDFVKPTFDAISDFDYTTYTDDYSFLDSAITADLVYITFPQSIPSTSQLDNLKQFVEGGGTLLVNGEFSPSFDTVNANVSHILNYIGSSIAVKQGIGSLNDSTLNATPPVGSTDIIEIGNFDITSGLETVKTGTFGALEIDNESAEAILVTSADATNNIVMAREAVGSGNVIVFADVNMFDADNNNLFSNIIIQSKINIEDANSAPTITSTSGTLAFTEGDAATVIDSSLTITDDNDTNIESATVTISSGFQSAEDVLAFSDTSAITGSWNASSGVLTLTGSDTLANYEAALESVTYNNTSDNPNTSERAISWVVNDGVDNSSAASSTIAISAAKDTWSFSNDYLEEQTGADLNGNGVVGDGTPGNATAPTNLSSATYAAGDDYLVEGTLASTSALDAIKSFFSAFNTAQGISFDSSSAYTYTNLSDTAENLSSVSSTDLGNVTTTLTVSDSASSPALLSTLQSIKGAFSGSTFVYNGVKGTTKDLADSRSGSFDWITNITASSGVKHVTLTDLSVSAANTQTLVADLSSSEYFFTISGMTANSSPFIAVPAGDNRTLGYQSDSNADATTNYTPGADSYTSGDYTITALGFANTATPTEGNLNDFNVASHDVSESVELTFHFYGGEQLSHVNISGADLSSSTGYSYSQTAGAGTPSVTDDIWTLYLKIEAGQPANTESVSDNSGKEVLGVMINSVSADNVGGYNDYGGSVFRTNAWWNDISLMSEGYKFSDLCPGFGINGTNGEEVDFDFYFTKDYLERTFSVDFDAIDGGFAGTGLSSVDASNDHSGTYIDVSKSGSTSALRLPVSITDVSATTAGDATEFYQVAFTNDSWSEANLSMVYGPSVNNAPPVLSTPTAGSIAETANSSGTTTSGLSDTLSASDDDGDSLTFSITDGATTDGTSTLAGSYGSLSLNTTSGEYTYTPNSSAIEALDDGDSASDSFTINATDGTETTSATYTVNLTGADDSSVITATTTGSLTEDSATTTVSGSISIADPDDDDSPSFSDVGSTTTSNGYGSYSLSNGTWGYTLDNDNTTVNSLNSGDTLSDSFTLTASDNSTQTITITINGADEDDDSALEEIDTDSEPEEIDTESELEDGYTLANNVRPKQSYVLVDNTGNNGNVVTALTTADTSLNLQDKFSKPAQNSQKTLRLLKKSIRNLETLQTTENRLINKAISFANQAKEEGVTQIDVRTIVPTSASEIPNQEISITGSAKTKQIEAFVIDLTQMPGVTQLQLHNIDYSVIIGPANITGGSGKNILQADDASQTINLGRDDDTLSGGGGNDTISSSGGNDVLAGQNGNDVVFGGRGADILRGGRGNDHLRGQKGQDQLRGGANRDFLMGGRDHDVLRGAHGRDTLIGGRGNDRLISGTQNDILRGRRGNDRLRGGEGNDRLNGGPGRDILHGEQGADRFQLSAGKDLITDYNPTEGDKIIFPKDLKLSITQIDNDILLANQSNEIHTILLNTSLQAIIQDQPQLA